MTADKCRWSGWDLVSPDQIVYCTPNYSMTTVWRKKTEGGWLYMTGYAGKGSIEFVPGGSETKAKKESPPEVEEWVSPASIKVAGATNP